MLETQAKPTPLFEGKIVRRATVDAVRKLDPRQQLKNPVMFVVLVGAALSLITVIRQLLSGQTGDKSFGFNIQITIWLIFTVLFANFAEAMAEGRGKAQADAL